MTGEVLDTDGSKGPPPAGEGPAAAMLVFEGVTKRFGRATALDGVSLDVPRGATTALIGPSGCGKSTLLRMVVGLLHPDEGRVLVGGTPVGPGTVAALRRRMGYVIQEGGLFPHLTARGNVHLAGRALGWAPGRVDERLEPLAAMTHFPADALDRYPSELSGGQRQRVSLMRALLGDPELLILDEPFSALDPLIRYDLQQETRGIAQSGGRTVLLVTHDLAEAGFLGDEVVLLGQGRIVQRGPFRDLLHRPANDFVRRFVEAQRPIDAAELPS